MQAKIIGAILLIVGTSLGAAMLALPVAIAANSFTGALLFLFGCWLAMTAGAFLILEINLALPAGNNLVSMARATLGKGGAALMWGAYLLLLYALLAAYIAGGADVLQSLAPLVKLSLSRPVAIALFAGLLGAIVYHGIRSVDLFNRSMMFAKLSAYLLLVILLIPHVRIAELTSVKTLFLGDLHYLAGALMVVITAYGYAIIIPSLRSYFGEDHQSLRASVLIGSLVPLVCYIVWITAIIGSVPRAGEHGILAMMHEAHAASMLMNTLSAQFNNFLLSDTARFFTSICMVTSFLGVTLSLSDFLADGLGWQGRGQQRLGVFAVTFIPPLAILAVYPDAFIKALQYAGVLCVVILIILPALMAWSGRYRKGLITRFEFFKSKAILLLVMIVGLILLGLGLVESIF